MLYILPQVFKSPVIRLAVLDRIPLLQLPVYSISISPTACLQACFFLNNSWIADSLRKTFLNLGSVLASISRPEGKPCLLVRQAVDKRIGSTLKIVVICRCLTFSLFPFPHTDPRLVKLILIPVAPFRFYDIFQDQRQLRKCDPRRNQAPSPYRRF